jgi:hypothetical protein
MAIRRDDVAFSNSAGEAPPGRAGPGGGAFAVTPDIGQVLCLSDLLTIIFL